MKKRTKFDSRMFVYGTKSNLAWVRKEAKKNKVSLSAMLDTVLTTARKSAKGTDASTQKTA